MVQTDILVIGGGITGCAAAYEFSKYECRTVLIEKENDVACGSTKANSALIHAGFDPEPHTLMAKYNVRGNILAYELAKKLDIPLQKKGSLVVAFSEDEKKTLAHLYENGIKNGVPELKLLNKEQTLDMEKNLSKEICGSLYAGTCGIVSPWEYTAALIETAIRNGVECYLENEVMSIQRQDEKFIVKTNQQEFMASYIINAAGLYADLIYGMAGGEGLKITAARGEYYLFDKPQGELVQHVIFQCPTAEGKGVVVAPTIHGNLFAGPDNRVAKERDDTSTHKEELEFVRQKAIKSVPSIDFSQNIRNFAGLRAIAGEDFVVGATKIKGFINAAGIKSPGLSSAPAIAEDLVRILGEQGLRLSPKQNHIDERHVVRFHELSDEQKDALIKKNADYGKVLCRCQTITQGEILDILNRPLAPKTLDGVKRRCGSGMGRCQGGFCEPRIHEVIAQHFKKPMQDILQDVAGTYIVSGRTKEEKN
ncbi:MAG: NAD(P)/FAD-dependent oxidoreductase [Christensenellaceae bacterium]